MMKTLIQAYFRRLGLPDAEAHSLHHKYYTSYGLAIRGLVRHHDIDPLDYDQQCDAALPLEEVLAPDEKLKGLLESVDRRKWKVWALTNAYVNHAVRVLSLTDLSSQFDGICSCNYATPNFYCKPEPEYFSLALTTGGQPNPLLNYFVDDSALNITGARAVGWGHSVLYDELGNEKGKLGGGLLEGIREGKEGGKEEPRVSVVRELQELRTVWPEVFLPQ